MRRTLWFVALAIWPSSGWAEVERDTDRDGLSDRVERATGTDPLRADTDEDGVPDGREDRDRDGYHDRGESDPRRAGLFPGQSPHIPEPIGFDLVRGLGARRGELEVNVLSVVDLSSRDLAWAPEVEWAFADGFAVELELPLSNRHLESVKLALQGTLPPVISSGTHGFQTFLEIPVHPADSGLSLVYLWGQRLSPKFSYLAMTGGRLRFDGLFAGSPGGPADLSRGAALLNASVFWDIHEAQTFGVESNTVLNDRYWSVRFLPQLHFQVTKRFRWQLAVGLEVTRERSAPLAATRLILE